ncbi:MAG TPA: hypothetical protein PLS49_08360, partial [Candidatus Woesebacteria bacterium]|nr:hypothetical protein [Candidatus Woesebacteria bacterium]
MEAISTEHSLQNRFIIERKNSAELKKNTKLTEKLQQLHPKQSLVGKYENTQFNINLNEALYIKDSSNDNHSYIFKIPNEDSNSFNLENLVLKPNSANGYDAYLVTYSLTQSERAAIENGHNIDVSQKTYIEPLDVANINISSKTGSACYELVIFGEKDCSCPEHQEWHQEKACTHPDTVYIWTMVDCGSSGGGGGGNGTPPGSGIPPGNPGSSGESSGEPDPRNTILLTPDGEIIDSPCAKIKAAFADDRFKEKVAAIDKPSVFNMDHEMGYAAGYPINTSLTEIQYPPMENKVGTHSVTLPSGSQYFGFIHSHTDDNGDIIRARIFSNADVATFLTSCVRNAQQHGDISDAYAMVITSEGNYMLKYTG